MKKTIIVCCILMGTYLFQSCGNGNSNKNGGDSSNAMTGTDSSASTMNNGGDSSGKMNNTMANTTPISKDDSNFAVKAAEGGMEEVQLGQVAQQNAMSQRVKDFGAMMVKDHTAAGDKLKTIASSKGLMLPDSLPSGMQKDVAKLSKKTGNDFDKAYMNMMLDDHKIDIKDFQKAGANCKDPDLKSFALNTLPTLQKHLDSAIAITGKR